MLVLLVTAVPGGEGPLHFTAPRWTRAQMEDVRPAIPWRFVYGTRDPGLAAALRRRATFVAGRLFGGDSTQVIADRDLSVAEASRHSLVLMGGPRENRWSQRFAPALPVAWTETGFRWRDRTYEGSGDALSLAYPNPLEPRAFVLLLHANQARALGRRGGLALGGEDWRILRDGEVVRSGRFAQSEAAPWQYASGLDRDRDEERTAYERSLVVRGHGLRVRAPGDLPWAGSLTDAAEGLLARMGREGLAAPPGTRPLTLTLYRSIEQKGLLVRDTRPESFAAGDGRIAALAGRQRPDLWSVAAARLAQVSGRDDSRFLVPAAVWQADRFEGESFAASLSRLYDGQALPTAEAAATRSSAWRSPLVWTPARALLARAAWECAPPRRARAVLLALLEEDPPGSLDSLAQDLGVPRARLATRYRWLADSLARVGRGEARQHRAIPWRREAGFERGACLAHAVSLESGYGSAQAVRVLTELRGMGFDAISLTPFGYLPSTHSPEIWPSSLGGPDEETDESVVEIAARARSLGLRVWLKPHLWTRGWAGDLTLSGAEWTRFFENYREFILHYAILAQREGLEGLVAGHELASSTRAAPERWRQILGDLRRVYSGTLTYGANWDEIGHVPFWDALDVVSVSFYAPLAARPTHDVAALRRGATAALARMRAVAARAGKPLLLSEVGYAPTPDAPVRPWEEGGTLDREAQSACWKAAIDAVDGAGDVMGLFVWKWFTSPGTEGREPSGFSPRGQPAEAEIARALRSWAGRPVLAAPEPR